jgi:hypothetical protein
MRDTNGVLFLNVELEVDHARARGGDAELWRGESDVDSSIVMWRG